MTGLHVIVWAFAIGAFKMGKTDSSIWGFSCSPKSDVLQPLVHSYLDYGKLCTMQVSSPIPINILEIADQM